MDLEKALAEGKTLTEIDIDTMLQKRRAEMPGYFEDSFSTIAAYGANAAMMHYHAEGEVNAVIEPKASCWWTTAASILRHHRHHPHLPGRPADRGRAPLFYTWMLQSHIDIARPSGWITATGFALDTIAREPSVAHLINYRCGTGHSVSFVGNVHEGPHA